MSALDSAICDTYANDFNGGSESIGIFPMVADLLHTGHLLALERAHVYCDKLIVALNVDPTVDTPNKNKPIESVFERYTRLRSCKFVDQIIPYSGEADLLLLLQTTPHSVRFVGMDHKDMPFTGDEFERNIRVLHVYIPRCHNISSTELRQRVCDANNKK